MSILTVTGIKKSFGANIILDGISFNVEPGDKTGLIGRNGSGKTTLFNIILGNIPPDEGQITRSRNVKAGHMSQFAIKDEGATLEEELTDTFSDLIRIQGELDALLSQISDDTLPEAAREKLILRHSTLHEKFVDEGGLYYKSRVFATLRGLGFADDDFSRTLDTLSGGQRSKLALSKLLLSDCDLLLLDEPTNYLDIDATEWLEDFLGNFPGAFIVISHDRYFLDRITNKTMELEGTKLSSSLGNYSSYMEHKSGEDTAALRKYENTMREVARIEGIIKNQRKWNRERNIRMANSRLLQVERLKSTLTAPKREDRNLKFSFGEAKAGGNDALSVEGLNISYGEKRVLSDVSFYIARSERVFLLGANGSGKTTLLSAVVGNCEYSGRVRIGANTDISYYDQLGKTISGGKTVLDEIWDEYRDMSQTDIRNALAAFLFTGDDVFQNTDDLSGGERARLELLKVMLSGANLLLLDEPTNHLDIYSKEALEDALMNYDGTMLIVSHDRYFINKLADRIIYLKDGAALDFDGTYDEIPKQIREGAAPVPREVKTSPAKAEFLKKKERDSMIRSLRTKISRAEEEIEELEAELYEIDLELSMPEVSSDYKRAMELASRQKQVLNQLDRKILIWEEQSELLFSQDE